MRLYAAIIQHIPNKNFQRVRYYGWYSNIMRGQRNQLDINTVFHYTGRYETAIQNDLSGHVPESPEKRFPISQGGTLMGENKKGNACICVVIAGLIVTVIGLLADVIGLGKDPGFGPQQTSMIVVGVVILVLGLKFGSKFCLCKRKKEIPDQ